MKTRLLLPVLFILAYASPAFSQLPEAECYPLSSDDGLELQIAPNPARDEVLVSWIMKKKGSVSISFMDINERMRLTIYLDDVPASTYTKSVSVEAFTPGIYFVLLSANSRVSGRKLLIYH